MKKYTTFFFPTNLKADGIQFKTNVPKLVTLFIAYKLFIVFGSVDLWFFVAQN